MKFVEHTYGNRTGILKFPDHYVGIAVLVDDTGIVANADGKKIVPAGTIVGGGFLADESVKAVKKNGLGLVSEGVLFSDVDVTYGPANGTAIIHGYIKTGALPEAPHADAIASLKQIQFIR